MKLAIGTVQFGLTYGIANTAGQVSRDEISKILALAGQVSVDTLDTAIAYGDSELRLGDLGVRDFKVVTKLPPMPPAVANVEAWVHERVRSSFARLKVGSVYGLLLHRSADLSGVNGGALAAALMQLKCDGLVEKIGASVYSPVELEPALNACPVDLIQAPFSIVDRRFLEGGWFRRLKNDGVEIHVRSVFLQGLLLVPRAEIPVRFERWGRLFDAWHKWLKEEDTSAVDACLGYVASQSHVDKIVVGVDSAIQFSEIIRAMERGLPAGCPDFRCDDEQLISPSNWNKLSSEA